MTYRKPLITQPMGTSDSAYRHQIIHFAAPGNETRKSNCNNPMDKWQPGKPDNDGKQLTASGADDKHFALSFGPIERASATPMTADCKGIDGRDHLV
ncbi:MAG: hypothetical protein K9K88_13390 [Desulfobacterales bacterium]|nr:hypothetical protein [Desulfobacterales bacterium]